MAGSEAPASAKAAGNSYPLSPTATAPVADSTPSRKLPQEGASVQTLILQRGHTTCR